MDTRDKRGHDAGVVGATAYHRPMQKGGWVYIMSNGRNGTLYLGVTSDLARRAWQHREGHIHCGHPRLHPTAPTPSVIPGFIPGIHAFAAHRRGKAWMAGSSPAMTVRFV